MRFARYCERMENSTSKNGGAVFLERQPHPAYPIAIQLAALVHRHAQRVPKPYAELVKRLQSSAIACAVSIAEAPMLTIAIEQEWCFSHAANAAIECSTILDVARGLELLSDSDVLQARSLLLQILRLTADA